MPVTSAAHYDPKWENAWYICENNAWWLLAQVDIAGAGCAGCQQVFILDVTSHIASWQLAQKVIIAFAALCLHLYGKHWEAPLFLRRAFSRAAGCCPRAACGIRVLFLISVASSCLTVCIREARAPGQGASSIVRGVCSDLVVPLSLGFHSSVTDVMWVLASTIMGDGRHSMWVVGLGGIWILKLSGKFTGTERGTSYSYKHYAPLNKQICPSPPVFNSETEIMKILGIVPTKIVVSPALFSGIEESF